MSTLTSIYASLYTRLSSALPEFDFKLKGNCYISQSSCKVDFSTGGSRKVYVYRNNPGLLVDYTRGTISIWDYVKAKYGYIEGRDVFKALLSMSESHEARKAFHTADHLDHLNSEISSSIWKFAKYHVKYLKEVRGYTTSVIRKMDVGYIPSKRMLLYYLLTKGFGKSQAIKALNALHLIGETHKIVIPYKDRDGNIIGFIGRGDNDHLPKYLYSKGMKKGLFNFHNANLKKPITLVEGVFDALHASAFCIENVVAIGGNMINFRQLHELKSAKEVYLLLDNDEAGLKGQEKAIEIFKNNNINYRILKLPAEFKDMDEFLSSGYKEDGARCSNNILEISGITEV